MNGSTGPRGKRVELLTPPERAVYDAVIAVGRLPINIRLSRARALLREAYDLVSEWTEETPNTCPKCGAALRYDPVAKAPWPCDVCPKPRGRAINPR